MSEKPILFSGPMVRAILDGKKAMTRRVMKPQPAQDCKAVLVGDLARFTATSFAKGYHGDGVTYDREIHCPYLVGQRLWVRETWAKDIPGCPNGVTYRADHLDPKGDGPANPITWRPSIFMPRWASRITLEITAVRVERVQEISEEDCCAEVGATMAYPGPGPEPYKRDMRAVFAHLWDSINGKRPGCAWSDNPWVWCVSFKRITE